MAIALVAHPALGTLAGHIGDVLPVTGLYYPARATPRDATLPFYGDLTAMLQETGARTCVFLSPYKNLHKDIKICLEIGVDVLCAGPVPQLDEHMSQQLMAQSGARLCLGGVHNTSPLFNKAQDQRCKPSFAETVYLRLVSGAHGPGLLPAWWSVCNQWSFALDLLGQTPSLVHISAYHHGRAYQVTLTAATATGTSIQLITAPQRPVGELTLLGQGGLISASAAQSGIATANAHNIQMMPDVLPPAEIAWLQSFEEKNTPPISDGYPSLVYGPIFLRGLRQALRQGKPIPIKL